LHSCSKRVSKGLCRIEGITNAAGSGCWLRSGKHWTAALSSSLNPTFSVELVLFHALLQDIVLSAQGAAAGGYTGGARPLMRQTAYLRQFVWRAGALRRSRPALGFRVNTFFQQPSCLSRERRLAEIRAAHARYCAKQLENDKTTRVLESGFGKAFSDRYMRTGAALAGLCSVAGYDMRRHATPTSHLHMTSHSFWSVSIRQRARRRSSYMYLWLPFDIACSRLQWCSTRKASRRRHEDWISERRVVDTTLRSL